jgi:hypothetical protein
MILSNIKTSSINTSSVGFAEGPKTDIDFLELKRLLTDILEKRPEISIRYRLIGHLWNNNFFAIKTLVDDDVIFVELSLQKNIRVRIQDIIQIELDGSFQAYRPNFHYTISPAIDK